MTVARAAAIATFLCISPAVNAAACPVDSVIHPGDSVVRPIDSVVCPIDSSADSSLCETPRSKRQHTFDGASLLPLPFFAAGLVARSGHGGFPSPYSPGGSQNTSTVIDDCLRFGGIATATALKACGYEGRSRWDRYAASAAFSYATMAATVLALKHAFPRTRPDGSADNSFPSGHTAVAFAGAAILHKEYGTTRSPWFSVAGFAMATATGVLRARNNRHWASDIMAGAGVGILSADIGYMLADIVFKDKGITRRPSSGAPDLMLHPSTLSLSMGTTVLSGIDLTKAQAVTSWGEEYTGLRRLADNTPPLLPAADAADGVIQLSVASATHVGAELSWFPFRSFPYAGIGSRIRLDTAPVRADGMRLYTVGADPATPHATAVSSTDRLTLFSHDAGLCLRLPLGSRAALGAKALAGFQHRAALRLPAQQPAGSTSAASATTATAPADGDRMEISSSTDFSHGFGISLTYSVRGGTACTVYCDYDSTATAFDGTFYTCPAIRSASDTVSDTERRLLIQTFSLPATLRQFSVGVSMGITF